MKRERFVEVVRVFKVRDGRAHGMGAGEGAVGAIPLWGVKKGRGVMETQFGETL
jgi:hypothetical protein